MGKYKALKDQLNKLESKCDMYERQIQFLYSDKSHMECNIKQLQSEIKYIKSTEFSRNYPNGKLNTKLIIDGCMASYAIELAYAHNGDVKRINLMTSRFPFSLTSYKLKQSHQALFIGIKLGSSERYFVVNKTMGSLISLKDENGLQDVEWIDASTIK